LSGDSKTLMLVNVNPTESDAGETACSLGFASRVRGVELGPAKKHIEAGAEVQELRGQLDALRQQVITLQKQHQKNTTNGKLISKVNNAFYYALFGLVFSLVCWRRTAFSEPDIKSSG
jgi:hypothetical protein